MCVELYIPGSSDPIEEYRVRVYSHGENLFRTEETEIALSVPVRQYDVQLKVEGHLLRKWPVPGISDDKPYMAFDYSSGKLIRSEELPGKTVCLIAHADLSLYPSEIVVEDSRLYGKWSEYKYYIVDLDGQDNISLINAQSESHSVSISSGKTSIGLTNGQRLKHISSQGNDVYIGNPPNIRIPLESEAQLDLWRISIHGTSLSEAKYCKLHELSDLIEYNQEGSAELILADERLLGSHGFGRFSIRLRGPNRVDERFVFCFLSHFDAMFDKHIYLPVRAEEIPKAILSVKTAENVEFEQEAPAELIDDNPCRMQVDLTEDFIKGHLLYNPANGSSCKLPVTICLPKVQWRIRGLTKWSIRTEDIFFDDWEAAKELMLDIRMPEDIEGRVKLICGSQESPPGEIHDGKICFELPRFSDTIRSRQDPSIFNITLLDTDFGVEDIQLFRIIDRWGVESIDWVQEIEGMQSVLYINWTEKGDIDQNRAVRLWNLLNPDTEPIIEMVEAGSCEVVFENPPCGIYRLQIVAEDPWAGKDPTLPPEGAPNTIDITVKPRFGCKRCDFFTLDRQKIADHIKEYHIESFVVHLTYEEIRQEYDLSLPEVIYKCIYCDFYCFGSYPNPTTTISEHVEKCPKRKGRGKILRIISDVNEIRQNLSKRVGNLPYAYKCRICGYRFKESKKETFMKHLIENHKNQLYSIW